MNCAGKHRGDIASAAAALVELPTAESLCARGGDTETRWSRAELTGRLVELSGDASLTVAVGLVLEAQLQAEPVAWLTARDSSFYPPDVADSGVDLDALVVVRVPVRAEIARAADRLLRSGAFGLVVLDLGAEARVSTALQGRLVTLAIKHDAAVVCLTAPSVGEPRERRGGNRAGQPMGSMVSLRAQALSDRRGDDHFRCKVKVIKDKRRGPGWTHDEEHRGPAGLR